VRDEKFKAVGQGSGFFVSSDGLLVTNFHVIEGAKFATVMLSDGSTLFVEGVAAVDKEADLALLKVNGTGRAFLTIGSSAPPKGGATVYAIGNPGGLTNTFSKGMVSGIREVKGQVAAIQTTAAISRGSSGGPLLAADGRVVGVTTWYLRGGQSLNFAIPASKVQGLVRNRGKLQVLASAGGKRLDKEASDQLRKAWAAMAKKDWSTAAGLLTDMRSKQKDNPSVWFALGYLHGELGNYDIAIQQYKIAITLKPDFATAYFNTGVECGNAGRTVDAIAAYKAAIAIRPGYASAYRNMGAMLCKLRQFAEAVSAFKKVIALTPGSADGHALLGDAYRHLRRYSESLAEYKKAVVLDPASVRAYRGMAWLYHFELKEHGNALSACKTAVALAPTDPYLHWLMASSYGELGRYTSAIAAYRKSLALKKDANVYAWLGNTYAKAARFTEAAEAYEKSLELEPNAKKYTVLAILYDRADRLTDAIAAYRKSLALKLDPETYRSLARAYVKADRLTEAITAYQQSLVLKKDASVYYDLGLAYYKANRLFEATGAFERAARLDPTGEIGRRAAGNAADLRNRLRR